MFCELTTNVFYQMNANNATIIFKKLKKIPKTSYIFDFTIPFL